MAITRPSKRSKADASGAAARDAKRTPKLQGKRQMLTFSLPPDPVARVDAKAAKERRSRANMIEVMLQESLERENASQEAA
jgi:hypothetical protein